MLINPGDSQIEITGVPRLDFRGKSNESNYYCFFGEFKSKMDNVGNILVPFRGINLSQLSNEPVVLVGAGP